MIEMEEGGTDAKFRSVFEKVQHGERDRETAKDKL